MSDAIVHAIAEPLGEVTLALTAIVLALKNQPGFNISAYDAEISSLLANEGIPSLMRQILEGTLDKPLS